MQTSSITIRKSIAGTAMIYLADRGSNYNYDFNNHSVATSTESLLFDLRILLNLDLSNICSQLFFDRHSDDHGMIAAAIIIIILIIIGRHFYRISFIRS